MAISTELVTFGGWERNLRLANDKLELTVTLEVGPRILSLAPRSEGQTGDNIFCVFTEHAGGSAESTWQSRGGHRLWLAPESEHIHPFTYAPDNHPVAHEKLGPGHVLFRAPVEASGVQKEIEITLHGDEARVTVTHRVSNTGDRTLAPLAPWALSVMAPGGVALVPQPPHGAHPRDLLPNRALVLWPYTDLTDARLHLGRGYITLGQDPARGPIKLGLAHGLPWAGYWRNGALFVKSWPFDANAKYPDQGCTCELFTNEAMLEVESLGPLVTLAPGQSVEHVEQWSLYTDVPSFGATNDGEIATALAGLRSLGK